MVFEVEEGEEVLFFLDGVVEGAVADPWDAGVDEGADWEVEGGEGELAAAEHFLGVWGRRREGFIGRVLQLCFSQLPPPFFYFFIFSFFFSFLLLNFIS